MNPVEFVEEHLDAVAWAAVLFEEETSYLVAVEFENGKRDLVIVYPPTDGNEEWKVETGDAVSDRLKSKRKPVRHFYDIVEADGPSPVELILMRKHLVRVDYADLNSRQKENYNAAKLASVLADYGYTCLRLSDDWHGADLIAHHINGNDLFIQLKGRLTVRHKYTGKNLWVAFPHTDGWYLFPHDEIQQKIVERNPKAGGYSWRRLPKWALPMLEPYWIDGEK